MVSSSAYHVDQGFTKVVAGIRGDPGIHQSSKKRGIRSTNSLTDATSIAGLLQRSGATVVSTFQTAVLLGRIPSGFENLIKRSLGRFFIFCLSGEE
jgi:hypothetical protein